MYFQPAADYAARGDYKLFCNIAAVAVLMGCAQGSHAAAFLLKARDLCVFKHGNAGLCQGFLQKLSKAHAGYSWRKARHFDNRAAGSRAQPAPDSQIRLYAADSRQKDGVIALCRLAKRTHKVLAKGPLQCPCHIQGRLHAVGSLPWRGKPAMVNLFAGKRGIAAQGMDCHARHAVP